MLWISKKAALEIPDLNGASSFADFVTSANGSVRWVAFVA